VSPDQFPTGWGDIHLSFQDSFRGSSELIRQRWKLYLEDIRGIHGDGQIALDLGCGRGEWLQFLADEGVESYGIDHDKQSVNGVIDQGLDARCEDLLTHVSGLPSGSLAAITAFNVVEQMSIERLLLLLEQSFRCLMGGGLLIIETPNPENLFVATRDPYLNPTRRNAIPPPLLTILVSSCGFTNAGVRHLHRTEMHPVSEAVLGELDQALAALLRRLQDALITGEDYAVLACRP
jgi:O-antigen chain-terminating methyltransferase